MKKFLAATAALFIGLIWAASPASAATSKDLVCDWGSHSPVSGHFKSVHESGGAKTVLDFYDTRARSWNVAITLDGDLQRLYWGELGSFSETDHWVLLSGSNHYWHVTVDNNAGTIHCYQTISYN